MTDDKSEKPINSHVSAYLRRPIRTLKKAEQDNDAARHLYLVDSEEHGPRRRSESEHQALRFSEPDRETPADTDKADLKR